MDTKSSLFSSPIITTCHHLRGIYPLVEPWVKVSYLAFLQRYCKVLMDFWWDIHSLVCINFSLESLFESQYGLDVVNMIIFLLIFVFILICTYLWHRRLFRIWVSLWYWFRIWVWISWVFSSLEFCIVHLLICHLIWIWFEFFQYWYGVNCIILLKNWKKELLNLEFLNELLVWNVQFLIMPVNIIISIFSGSYRNLMVAGFLIPYFLDRISNHE